MDKILKGAKPAASYVPTVRSPIGEHSTARRECSVADQTPGKRGDSEGSMTGSSSTLAEGYSALYAANWS